MHPEPCVIFVVRRKWAEGASGPVAQRLPSRLLTYGVDGGAHRLFAVPTDVQPASWFVGGAARASGCVRLDDPVPAFRLPGTIACGVRAEGAVPAVPALGLSAMHVLSPVAADPLPASGAAFTAVGGGDAVRGRSAPWGGAIDADSGRGFDAQLAQIDDARWFNDAYRGWKLSRARPYVVARDAFDELAATRRFLILAPDNHPLAAGVPREPMLAQFTAMAHEELPLEYQVRRGGALHKVLIRHPELIRLRVLDDCPLPLRGDSGSAVLSWWPDDSVVFVGLFIASGDGPGLDRVAYAIPSWQLFDPLNWRRLPPGTSALTPRFRVP